MRGRMLLRLVTVTLAIAASPLQGQRPAPLQDLIDQAHVAMNGLRYADAAKIAQSLLDAGAEGHPDVEVIALELLAAALFPEERRLQRPDDTREYLRQLVWRTPAASIPRALSWPGLDSLMEVTRAETYVVYADTRGHYALQGVGAHLSIPIRATRVSNLRMTAYPQPDGRPLLLDSARNTVRADMVIRPLVDERVALPSGAYILEVSAVDVATGETVARRFDMNVDAPPLEPLSPPDDLQPSVFLPERTERQPTRFALVAAGVGLATVVVGAVLRSDPPSGAGPMDGRAFVIGGTLTLATLVGAFTDHSRSLPGNVASNARLRREHEGRLQEVVDENRRRRNEYAAQIVILGERR